MGARLREIVLRRLRLPLIAPYRLSYRTFEEFEPILVELRDDMARTGFGERHISPGSSNESRDGGWAFAQHYASAVCRMEPAQARAQIEAEVNLSPVAATALISALEMLEGHPLLEVREAARVPLLSPVNGHERSEIRSEIDTRLGQGFQTFKVKVGADVDADLERLNAIQSIVGDRATLRVDANRGFSEKDAINFATRMAPEGIELFEQPCAAEDWDANAAVAKVSRASG